MTGRAKAGDRAGAMNAFPVEPRRWYDKLECSDQHSTQGTNDRQMRGRHHPEEEVNDDSNGQRGYQCEIRQINENARFVF